MPPKTAWNRAQRRREGKLNFGLFKVEFLNSESNETYGQTRGLSNLDMKHVGELAIIGVLLKAVKTSRVRTTQGRTYLTNVGFFRWLLLHTYTYYKHIRPEQLGGQLNMEW